MKNIVYAIILSIIIHVLFFLTIEIKNDTKPSSSIDKNNKKYSIRYVKLKQKKEPKKVPNKITKNIVAHTNQFKKVIKENIKKAKKRNPIKKPKRTIPKPTVKTVVKPTYTQPLPKKVKLIKKRKTLDLATKKRKKTVLDAASKRLQTIYPPVLPKNIENKSLDTASKKIQKNTLESFLLTPNIDEKTVDRLTQSYIDLYGAEFESFTKIQKVFLKKHLKDIGLITQRNMFYPDVSVRTRQEGTNVVEFMLYPNGDISKVKLISSTSYDALDRASLQTIQIAHIDYPRPKKPTKIRIHMTYFMY